MNSTQKYIQFKRTFKIIQQGWGSRTISCRSSQGIIRRLTKRHHHYFKSCYNLDFGCLYLHQKSLYLNLIGWYSQWLRYSPDIKEVNRKVVENISWRAGFFFGCQTMLRCVFSRNSQVLTLVFSLHHTF